jgi:hypothetical protein
VSRAGERKRKRPREEAKEKTQTETVGCNGCTPNPTKPRGRMEGGPRSPVTATSLKVGVQLEVVDAALEAGHAAGLLVVAHAVVE